MGRKDKVQNLLDITLNSNEIERAWYNHDPWISGFVKKSVFSVWVLGQSLTFSQNKKERSETEDEIIGDQLYMFPFIIYLHDRPG